ncbi:hypothetical protein [Streptomyces sp. NPDC058964]
MSILLGIVLMAAGLVSIAGLDSGGCAGTLLGLLRRAEKSGAESAVA